MRKIIAFFTLFICCIIIPCCGDEFPDATIRCGQTYNIPDGNKYAWTSENELIASVIGSTVKGEHVGKTEIFSGDNSFFVTVEASSNIYKEPCLEWEAPKSTVKSYMKGFLFYSEEETELYYTAYEPTTAAYRYDFEDGCLNRATVGVDGSQVSLEEMLTFLKERYIYEIGTDSNELCLFSTLDKNSTIIMSRNKSDDSDFYFITYIPQSNTDRSYMPAIENYSPYFNKSVLNKFKSIINNSK